MRKSILLINSVVIAALAGLWVFEHQSRTELRRENAILHQQVDELTAENQRLTNTPAQAGNTTAFAEDQLGELLRLRNEVAILRTQTNSAQSLQDPKIGELQIVSARYGSGTNVADVTARVIELLHREPRGFVTDRNWLQIDPAPYKNKTVTLVYDYGGHRNVFSAGTGERVSLDLLMANAGK